MISLTCVLSVFIKNQFIAVGFLSISLFNLGNHLFSLGFFPSVCSGVVAKVVEAQTPQSYLSIQRHGHLFNHEHFPAMLETTAAIHPGASGGAVINSDGHMIGLVTR